jgi:hypothetical protein
VTSLWKSWNALQIVSFRKSETWPEMESTWSSISPRARLQVARRLVDLGHHLLDLRLQRLDRLLGELGDLVLGRVHRSLASCADSRTLAFSSVTASFVSCTSDWLSERSLFSWSRNASTLLSMSSKSSSTSSLRLVQLLFALLETPSGRWEVLHQLFDLLEKIGSCRLEVSHLKPPLP